MSGYDDVDLRNFGGQKKKRTAFAQSDTGKQIMTAMIDAVRRKEASGMYGSSTSFFPYYTSSVWQYLLWLRNQG